MTRLTVVVEDNGAMRCAYCALRGLSGRPDVALHRQVAQKRLHLGFAHLPGVALAVEKDVSFYPVDVGSLGPLGVPQPPDPVPNLIQQLGWRSGGR